MRVATAELLNKNKEEIMNLWFDRTMKEIKASSFQKNLALRNSLPDFLSHLASTLSQTIDRSDARKKADKEKSSALGKKHGKERARSIHYTIDQLIFEYHILRQVIFDVIEKVTPLDPVDREVIISSIEQAVNDAATEFSDTLRDIQEKLSHTLAHDLRGPLTTIKTSAQLILRRPDDVDGNIAKSGRICNSVDRLDKMIRDLLDASRLRAGEELLFEFEECDLDWIIRQVGDEVNFTSNDKVVIQSRGQCLGNWNPDALRRIVENLISNAIKYGSEKTKISVTLEQDDKSARLTVHNEGKPIPEEEMVILFQQYKRLRSQESLKTGWGIGLTVVEGLVDAHHGSIKVDSAEGKGTSFIISLPKNPSC